MTRTHLFSAAILSAVVLSLTATSVAHAANYHVTGTGSDAGDGSASSPFRQIRRALQVAGAGDTILVGDGSYLGFDVRNKSATATSPLVIRATGSSAVVTPTTDRTDNRDTIFVTFSSGIVLEGLRSFGANRAALRIDQSPSVTVRECVFGNNSRWGIFTDFSDDLLLERNECYGSGLEHGIYVSNSGDRPILRGNYCHDNAASGIQLNADLSAGGDGLITGALLENNLLFGNGTAGGAAINLDGVQDSTIQNNLIAGNFATGIVTYRGNGAAGPRNVRLFHNSIDQPSTGRWCLHIGGAVGPVVVRNNILFTRHSFRGSIEYFSTSDVANTDSDYNILSKVTPDYGATILTLAQWQAQGKELHSRSLALNQLWVSPTPTINGDYRLLVGSPAVDAGEMLSTVTRDLAGNPRPAALGWDLGCLEQTGTEPPPPPAPATLQSLVLTPSTLTGGSSASGTILLTGPAPPGGFTVAVRSNSRSATVPASVTVPAGATGVNFSITTRRVTRTTTATITATAGGVARSATLTLTR